MLSRLVKKVINDSNLRNALIIAIPYFAGRLDAAATLKGNSEASSANDLMSSKIILNSLSLPANSTGKIALNELTDDVTYNINCEILTENGPADIYENVKNTNDYNSAPTFATLDEKKIDLQVMNVGNGTNSNIFSIFNFKILRDMTGNILPLRFKNLDNKAYVDFDYCDANVQLEPIVPPIPHSSLNKEAQPAEEQVSSIRLSR